MAGLAAITAAAGSVSAPMALRARVEAMQRGEATEAPRRERERRRGWGWLPSAGLAGAALAAVAIVVAFSGGPATAEVLAAAVRAPVAAAQLDPGQPRLLKDQVDDVRFPNFEGKFGWEAEGVRTDEIGGRETKTVFYRREGRRIAYTIVEGEQLAWPPGSDRAEQRGHQDARLRGRRPQGGHLAPQRPHLHPVGHQRPERTSCSSSPPGRARAPSSSSPGRARRPRPTPRACARGAGGS